MASSSSPSPSSPASSVSVWPAASDGTPQSLVLPHVTRIAPYVPGKPAEELTREQGIENPCKLASNENPIGPSPRVLTAIAEASQQVHRYPDGYAFELRRVLSEHLGVRPDELSFGSGSNELIDLLCRAFVSTDHHVVTGTPSFVAYDLCPKIGNVPISAIPLRDNRCWDLEGMLAAMRPNTRLVFIANPNNPTGGHVPHEELAGFLHQLPEHVIPVLDEAYYEYADAEDYRSALTMRELCPRLVVLRTFSKAYGLAGLRIGYAVGPAEIGEQLHRVRMPFNVSSLAQAAAIAALSDQQHVRRVVELNARERGRVASALGRLGLEVYPSQGNFLYVDFGTAAAPIYKRLLRRGVIARPMGPTLPNALRITVGLPEENELLLEATRALSSAGGPT